MSILSEYEGFKHFLSKQRIAHFAVHLLPDRQQFDDAFRIGLGQICGFRNVAREIVEFPRRLTGLSLRPIRSSFQSP